ncbi:MAG: SLC13 family permease [Nocardioidaceae bacterium]
MSIELASILLLFAMFILASTLPINLGVMAFAGAYLLGTWGAGLDEEQMYAGFPASLFVLLVGVTYLFAIAQLNGTIDWLIGAGIRLVRGQVVLIPWIMYLLTAALAAMGALAAAALACVAPLAMRFAKRHRINPLMMGIMVCMGSVGGSFSPISPFGVITNDTLESNDLSSSPGWLFANNLIFSALVSAVVFVVLGGLKLRRPALATIGAGAGPEIPADRDETAPGGGEADVSITADPLNWRQALTLGAIVALVAGALIFDQDVGLLAFLLAAPLSMIATERPTEVVKHVPWSVVLLVAGMLTYVGVLDAVGTLDYVSDLVNKASSPLMVALLICFIGAIISAFAATAAVLSATIPLIVPLLSSGELSIIGVTTAVCIASTIVDSSPMSTNGALLLANQTSWSERRFFRSLLVWAVLTVTAGPPLVWAMFVVTTR